MRPPAADASTRAPPTDMPSNRGAKIPSRSRQDGEFEALQLQPIQLSSGNLIADRRFEWARDCEAKGDLAGAADLLARHSPAYTALVCARRAARKTRRPARLWAFAQARVADPQDRQRGRRSSCTARRRTSRRHAGKLRAFVVRRLRGGIRSGFDGGPKLPRAGAFAFVRSQRQAGRRMKFGSVLDLGCGTGLAALPFRPVSDWMVGIHSPAMLAQARAKVCMTGWWRVRCCGFSRTKQRSRRAIT